MNAELATTEPPVFANVLRMRMAAMGLLILERRRTQTSWSLFSLDVGLTFARALIFVLKITDSAMEQQNDVIKTTRTLPIKNNIRYD